MLCEDGCREDDLDPNLGRKGKIRRGEGDLVEVSVDCSDNIAKRERHRRIGNTLRDICAHPSRYQLCKNTRMMRSWERTFGKGVDG